MTERALASVLALVLAGPALAAHPEPARYVSTEDGARIAYYVLSETRTTPVLVLSGGPGTDSSYMRARGALDRLAKSRTLVFYDQRGTSRSSDSDGSETIAKYVEDIESILDAIGAAEVDLLGHSFGGYLAIAYTARHPRRVRGLILVDSAAPNIADVTQLMDQIYPDRIDAWREKRATLGKRVKAADVVGFQSMEFVDPVALGEFLDAVKDHESNMDVNNALREDMAGRDYWREVRGFRQPTLVVHGRFDAIIAPSDSWKLHQALPSSTFRIVEAAGHLPHIERPEAFLDVVRPFLESLDRSNPSGDTRR